jgi:ribosome maturation factor RimP
VGYEPTFLLYAGMEFMDQLQQKLKEEVEPICGRLNFFLFDIQIKGDKRQLLVKVIADTESGITLSECQRLSKEVSDVIINLDLIPQAFRLEVSSPGIDKPLQFPYEYRRNVGRNLLVVVNQNGVRKEIKGELTGYNENKIEVNTGTESMVIPVDEIQRANVKLKW